MKIIDINNGNFHLSTNEIITSKDSYSKVLTFESVAHTEDMGNSYEWIYFRNIHIDNFYFFVAVSFYKKKIKSVNFSFTLKPQEKDWDNWNEKEELQLKKMFDLWLDNNIGEKTNFNWGKINSYYDKREQTSGIRIEYN
ncbi:hypothetical protein [Flavobacterium sp. FlaQc-30]|uniref:hypothetical protein n=1 Tax=Flavobacterium sp. FlaQc-30 TaxID=3374179 RepID=UPI0037572FB2